MSRTVKQIAADCGVSEQAVRAWCRRNHVAKDAKGSFAIDETTLSAIYQHYHVDARKQVSQHAKASFATCETFSETVSDASHAPSVPWEVYQDLRRQLEIKDSQIADLSKALAASQESLKAAQVLHGADKQEALLGAAAGTEDLAPDEVVEEGEAWKSKSLFDRIFKR